MTAHDSLIGVKPACGCITAWMDIALSDRKDKDRFYREMAASGREVRHANLADIRDRLDRCPHDVDTPAQIPGQLAIGDVA